MLAPLEAQKLLVQAPKLLLDLRVLLSAIALLAALRQSQALVGVGHCDSSP